MFRLLLHLSFSSLIHQSWCHLHLRVINQVCRLGLSLLIHPLHRPLRQMAFHHTRLQEGFLLFLLTLQKSHLQPRHLLLHKHHSDEQILQVEIIRTETRCRQQILTLLQISRSIMFHMHPLQRDPLVKLPKVTNHQLQDLCPQQVLCPRTQTCLQSRRMLHQCHMPNPHHQV